MKIGFKLFVLVWVGSCFGQNKQLLYDLRELPTSLLLNPGVDVSNYRLHIGVPLLSHIHFGVGISGASAYDLFADDGVDFNSKLRNVLDGISRNDIYTFNQQLELFYIGFRPEAFLDNRYFSFGMYQEIDMHAYHPKDPIALFLEGNGGDNLFRSFNLNDINFSAELLTVLHFGFNKQKNDKLTYGFRAKLYSSVLDARSTNNRGEFFSESGQQNFYRHVLNSDISLNTSGFLSLSDVDSEDIGKEFRKRALFGGNLGLGVDIGFSYAFTDQISITGSLLDIGFIRHKKDTRNYEVKDFEASEGVEIFFPGLDGEEENDDYVQELIDDLEERFTPDTTSTAYTSYRPIKLNASLRYDFGEKKSKEDCNCLPGEQAYRNTIGIQLYGINRSRLPQLALTTFYYKRLGKFLRLKGTYTIDKFTATNIGLGMSMHFGNFNFYLMGDNLLSYVDLAKAKAASLQFGFNYVLPRKENPFMD